MEKTLLLVDDDESTLAAIKRLLAEADAEINVLSAGNAREALDVFENTPITVLLTDNRMPGMSGIELLSQVKVTSPDTVRLMMTGYADLETAVRSINDGEVYKFIVKPWDDNDLVNTLKEAIDRASLAQSLKRSDEPTLLSLAQTIELKDPYTKGHCERVAMHALLIADHLDLSDEMKKNIKYGGWLHDCGKIGVPEAILNKNGPLDEEELKIIRNHPRWGADVMEQAKLNQTINNIVYFHHERYDGKGYPEGLSGENIPIEARVVAVADVYDALTSDRAYRERYSKADSLKIIRSGTGTWFDPRIVDIFLNNIG